MTHVKNILALTVLFLAVASSSALAQERVLVGAYDPAHANGIVIITNNQNFFGLRFLLYRQGAAVESSPQQLEFGPHAPGGVWSQIAWRTQFDDKTPVTLQWSRFGKNVVIGRLTAPSGVRVAMEAYRPWESSDAWGAFSVQADRQAMFGEQVQATSPGLRRVLIRTDRTGIGAANYNSADAMREMLLKDGHPQQASQSDGQVVGRLAALSFDLGQNQSIGFVAVVGDDFDAMDREASKLLQRPVAELFDQAGKNYENSRAFSSGALGDSLEVITRLLGWNRFYWAEKNLDLVAVYRQSGGGAPTDGSRGISLGWDSFLTGSMAMMVEPRAASDTMHALLEGQLLDGRVPLRRRPLSSPKGESAVTAGRSMPPIGAVSVWRVYLATRDLELLAWAYPRLKQWNDWWIADRGDGQSWRDGNGDGLLEFGYDAEAEQGALGARTLTNDAKRKLAFSESGLDERPQWNGTEAQPAEGSGSSKPQAPGLEKQDVAKFNDRTRTLEFSTVGLNALYALDTETMALIARELGLGAEAGIWQTRYENIRTFINTKLWSEEDKLYLNRHWDGRLSRRISLENFFPLLAGIPDEERAKQMLEVLRDPKRFGFLHPLPTIARDDAAFDGKSPGRGAVWAPMNYLLYLGLKRYGFFDEAGELARRSNATARAALGKSGRLYDLYSSADDSAIEEKGDGLRGSFAGLMLWPALEELISADPWAGLTIGSTATTEESRIERLDFSGGVFDIIVGPKRTVLRRGDRIEVECEGAARLRTYRTAERVIMFGIETREQIRVLVPAAEGRKITVSVDEKVLGSTSAGAAASFKVPAGAHKVLVVK
ncbi:MAG: MGH1-like glycoside hydrolase domain-containing protein [Blastocatellia bacterium]